MTQSTSSDEQQLVKQAKIAILTHIPRVVHSASAVLSLAKAYAILDTGKLPAEVPTSE